MNLTKNLSYKSKKDIGVCLISTISNDRKLFYHVMKDLTKFKTIRLEITNFPKL